MVRLYAIAILVLLASPVPAEAQKPAAPMLERVGWLAGCWEMSVQGVTFEESWMAPRGGTMVGMSRTVRDGRTLGYEYLLISRTDSALVYRADPSGQAATEFQATAVDEGRATFENPEHDYPRRVTYRRVSADSLVATIDDGEGGNRRQFPFRRTGCGAEAGG